MTHTYNRTLALSVLTTLTLAACQNVSAEDSTVVDGGAPQKSAANLDEPVARVGSEVIRRRDLEPPPGSENVRRGYQIEAAFHLVVEKTRITFCQQANCTPDPKD